MQGEREGGDDSVRWQSERVFTWRRAQRGQQLQELEWRRREGDFCPYVGGEEVSCTEG
jgi:hypothetical protein